MSDCIVVLRVRGYDFVVVLPAVLEVVTAALAAQVLP